MKEKLKKARLEKGYTLEQMGEKLGCTKVNYYYIENGMVGMSIEQAKIIAKVLDVDISVFFEE